MILNNYHPNCDVLLSTTIGVGTFLLFLIPAVILVHFHRQEEQRRAQVEGDAYAMHLSRPYFTRRRVMYAWIRVAVCFTLGLSLFTVHSAKKSNLQTTFDYIGPMQVRSVKVGSQESWRTSGLTRKWVVQGMASVQVQWSPDEVEEHPTSSSSLCVTDQVFEPCTTPGQPCETIPCTTAKVAKEEQRVRECVRDAMESYDRKMSVEEFFVMRTNEWVAKDPEILPNLLFRGDSSTCAIRAGISVDEEESLMEILVYIGMASVLAGSLLLFIQPLVWHFEHKTFHERSQIGHDGHTVCGEDESSIGPLDEELGKVEDGTIDETMMQDSENFQGSTESFGSLDLEDPQAEKGMNHLARQRAVNDI